MEERKPTPPRNSSRTLAVVAVAVLVMIAIAGIVLATLRRDPPAEVPVAAVETHPASSPMTKASAAALAAEAEAGPTQVVFASDSTQLSEIATDKLLRLAEKARKDKRSLTIVGRFEARPEGKQERVELARKRAIAVRGILETNGVPLAKMETRIEPLAAGIVSGKEANRIEVALR